MRRSYEELRKLASDFNQEHVFQYWDGLNPNEKEQLLNDVSKINFARVNDLISGKGNISSPEIDLTKIEAPPVYLPQPTAKQVNLYKEAIARGRQLLSENKVATMVVAGGQGTRLGFDAPKGTLPTSPIKNKTLFMLFAENIRAICNRYACRLPWYIMTSDATDEPTREYFEANDYLGLNPDDVHFFKQGVMPAVDDTGRILLSEKHRIALSPNGHGGSLTALKECDILDDLSKRGIEVLSYFQVDNPLVSPADPLFIGLHSLSESQMSSIAVPKADDLERVGNFVQIDGKIQIIEYSDLPDELAHAKNPDGSRMLNSGSIAIHLICPKFVGELTGDGKLELPWHIARKKVPYVDPQTGKSVDPEQPNARKFEMFIFDAIPLATKSIILEQPRLHCFSPVKNAEGIDSLETAQRDMILRSMEWLEKCGVKCPKTKDGLPAAKVEISPLKAIDAEQLKESLQTPPVIKPGDSVYID